MYFRTTLFGALIALASTFPAATAAQQKMAFTALDPDLARALARAITADHLRALGYDSVEALTASAIVSVATSDCASSCNSELDRGMCLCRPEASGGCPAGGTPTTQAGSPLCKTLPANATIFASDGGLGTTRVQLARPARN